MENFITGYAANETMMRAAVRKVLGDDALRAVLRAAALGLLRGRRRRLPRRDRAELRAHPGQLPPPGVRRQAVRDHRGRLPPPRPRDRRGRRARRLHVIDLHALPGSQNQHWHSDNPTHRALFWEHRHFQDRVVGIWEAIADRYKGNPWVAGYNLMNEPADESRAVVGPFYERLSAAIREIDPEHILFFDGNTYSTEFGFFGEPLENAVYTLHDYVPAGLGRADEYPGPRVGGGEVPRALGVRAPHGHADLRRRVRPDLHGRRGGRRGAPPDPRRPARDLQALRRRLRHVDVQGPRPPGAHLRPARLALRRAGRRLRRQEARGSGSTSGAAPAARTRRSPSRSRTWSREAPDFDPYPWGRFDFVRTLVLNITLAQPLAGEYAELFRGLGEDELIALADSFAFENCVVRESLRDQLRAAEAARSRSG